MFACISYCEASCTAYSCLLQWNQSDSNERPPRHIAIYLLTGTYLLICRNALEQTLQLPQLNCDRGFTPTAGLPFSHSMYTCTMQHGRCPHIVARRVPRLSYGCPRMFPLSTSQRRHVASVFCHCNDSPQANTRVSTIIINYCPRCLRSLCHVWSMKLAHLGIGPARMSAPAPAANARAGLATVHYSERSVPSRDVAEGGGGPSGPTC